MVLRWKCRRRCAPAAMPLKPLRRQARPQASPAPFYQCDKPSPFCCGHTDKRIASLPRQALQPQWLFERHVADKEKPATQDGAVQIASQAATDAWQAV